MNDIDIKELEKKILEGIALAYQKLVEQKKERRRRISVFTGWKDCSC